MIRDRKMYVAPTPSALTDGTTGLMTLIVPETFTAGARFREVGRLKWWATRLGSVFRGITLAALEERETELECALKPLLLAMLAHQTGCLPSRGA